jgi:YVTN family beta-propeller protein
MRPGQRMAAAAVVLAAFVGNPGAASAQNAGSNGLIAVDKQGNKIRFYDPATLAELKVLDSPEKTVHELAISHDRRKAYVPLYGDGIYGSNKEPNNKILIIDLATRTIEGQIDLGEHQAPHGLAATRDGKLWVASDKDNKLLLVDPVRRSVEASYQGPGKGGHFLAMLPDESKIYISNKEAGVSVFDVRRRAFIGTIPIGRPGVTAGNGSGSEGLTPSPDGKRLLVVDNADSDIRVIDTATDKEIDRAPLQGRALTNVKRTRLVKLMFSPDGRWLVATSYGAGQGWVIDAGNLRRQRVVPLAKGPQGIAFAPDGRTAVLSSHDSGLLTRVDLATGQPLGATDGGVGIEVLAFY